jgi:S-(hydroxymethyl)glutathione dehydrogenase/alcohol dehydrogenase
MAKQCGATVVINASKSDVWKSLAEIFKDEAPDVFIDNTGNPEIISRGYELIKAAGRVILVGVPKKGANASLYTLPLHFGKSITGTTGGETVPQEDIPRYMALTAARKINLNDLITEIAPLSDINKLLLAMRDGSSAGRCLVDFTL